MENTNQYKIQITEEFGDFVEVYEIDLTTDRLEWSIQQWCRNRAIVNHEILEEGSSNGKSMLLG